MPQIDIPVALLGCLGTCTAYAALLSSKTGRKFTVRHTWVTVVAGVSIGTLRHAVDELVADHVLVRQQGRGTDRP